MARKLSDDDIAAKRFEANQLFTPSTPINISDLFAGRTEQLFRIINTIGDHGKHILLFGERGVGKTSLAQIAPFLIPAKTKDVRFIRVQSFPDDTFSSISKIIFREITFKADFGEGEREYDISDLYKNGVEPHDFVREMSFFNQNDVPVIVIDEFNEIKDESASSLFANAIKALSDAGVMRL